MWNGTMFVDLDWPLNASSLLSASAELLVTASYDVYKHFYSSYLALILLYFLHRF